MQNFIFSDSKKKYSYKESLDICYKIIQKNYENFPVYMFFLKKNLMDDFAALYAFSRGIDFIGDELDQNTKKGIKIWERELSYSFKNKAKNPIFIVLQESIKKHKLNKEPFRKLIQANQMDQKVKRYKTMEDLLYYCDHSANPVGEAVLSILGYKTKEIIEYSNSICTALQLTNFLQDIKLDKKINRVYIPEEHLKNHRLHESDFDENKIIDETFKSSFEGLIRELVIYNQSLYNNGKKILPFLKKRDGIIIQIFISSGEKILNKINKNGINILTNKPKTNNIEKIFIILKSFIRVLI